MTLCGICGSDIHDPDECDRSTRPGGKDGANGLLAEFMRSDDSVALPKPDLRSSRLRKARARN